MARLAILAAAATMGAFAGNLPAIATQRPPVPAPATSPGPSVRRVRAVDSHFVHLDDQAAHEATATATHYPQAISASAVLAKPAGGNRLGAPARLGATPLTVRAVAASDRPYTGPTNVSARIVDQKVGRAAGVNGVLMTVAAGDTGRGVVSVGLNYAGFGQLYGGNYGQRLSLVSLPGCVLTSPELAACRTARPMPSTNDLAAHTVSAAVTLDAATQVLAAVTTPQQEGGPGGSYAATTLKPSGSWAAGSSTGSFTYDYPIAPPQAASDLVPDVGLSYDSGSIDGQTSSTQAQANWAGDGWSTPESFIEQSFTSCSDKPEGTDAPKAVNDDCYAGQILTMSLGGSSTALVYDDKTHTYRPESDNGDVVTHVTNSGNGTGTHDSDYWRITSRDGTVYQFGRNRLPGWSATKPTTNSVDSKPVYSAHSDDPCYNSAGFSSSVCPMAYRWRLDYVTDTHGNAMSYYYDQDTNNYGQFQGAKVGTYIRDSHLDHIDYGFTDGNAYGTVADKIVFQTGARCTSGTCDPLNSSTKANWKDVPYDLICSSTTTCQAWSPSFFSTVRLTSILTQQWSPSAQKYLTVDSYALDQSMPATGDATSPTLWLKSITHTGSGTTVGGLNDPLTLPIVSFTGTALANRVDRVTDGLPALYRYRIATITTETGSVITPTYTLMDPCSSPVKLDPATNTSSCYPVYWTPDSYTTSYLDWFNKYSVTRVTQTDPTGGAAAVSTNYKYLGGAAWHHDDNELVKAKYRTYGEFRGFGTVQTRLGDGVNDAKKQTLSQTTYYRGMGATVTDSQGGKHEDADVLAGQALESTDYLGDGGPVDHTAITSYWVSGATATRARTGVPDLVAHWVAPAETYTRQAITSGGATTWRVSETDTTYDDTPGSATVGLPIRSYSHTVPAVAAYDRCTSTSYAPVNTGKNLVGLESEVEIDAVTCGGFHEGSPASVPAALNTLTAPSVDRPTQVVSDNRTYYDDASFSTAWPQGVPGTDDVTMQREANGWSSGAFAYQTNERDGYDSYGRTVSVWDANSNRVTTSFTTDAVGLTTAMTMTNPLSHPVSTTLDPQRGLTLTVTDANGVVTTQQSDALGRTRAVWQHGRATTLPADVTYDYKISNTGVTAITKKTINDSSGYLTSTTMYDALLRERQTQSVTPAAGRMVADTFYDSRGWVKAKYNGWWDSTATPDTTIISAADLKDDVPNADLLTYDGLGRVVRDESDKNGMPVSTTTTVYGGDRTTVVPPEGGTTKTTITDPLGRTGEIDEWDAAPIVVPPADTFSGIWSLSGGTVVATKYGYDTHSNQSTVTSAKGNSWVSTFDLLGRVVAKVDPDAGSSSISYDANGNVQEATDVRGKTISYTYDALNRKTGEYAAPYAQHSAANQTGAWVFDNSDNSVADMTNPVGHLTTEKTFRAGATSVAQQAGFNVFGESLGETVTIPDSEGALAGSYTVSHTYTKTTGLAQKDIYPAVAGLPAETVLHAYNSMDLPNRLSGSVGYVQHIDYDAFGRTLQETIGADTNLATLTNQYDQHTSALVDQLVTRSTGTPTTVDEQAYKYDLAGNLTRQQSTRLGASTPTETQCYAYDTLNRLSQAWTATDSCVAAPAADHHETVGDSLGSASAYWTTWTYDVLGNRKNQVEHDLIGAADTATSYTYDGNGAHQPDTLTSTTGGKGGATSYRYDAAGNMINRNTPADGNQTLTWDDHGSLLSVTGGTAGDSRFTYDADGDLLIEKNPGKSTLYLGDQQISLDTNSGVLTGVRYYALPGGGTAYRTGSGTNYGFEIDDQHGTPTLYLDATAQKPSWRQYTPWGAARGATVAVPDNRGFLNKVTSTTGLVLLGAREYDTGAGRFISVDPVFEANDPMQLNGYSYGSSDPVDNSDPTGLISSNQCATYLCYQQVEAAAIQDRNSRAMACATRLCHDDIMANGNCHCSDNSHGGAKLGGHHGGGTANSHGGGGHDAPPKKKHWWNKAAHWVGHEVNDHAGLLVGIAVGAACTIITGGSGAVLCGALGAFVGSAIDNTRKVANGQESVRMALLNIGVDTAVGAATGFLANGLGGGAQAVAEEAAANGARGAQRAFAGGALEGVKKLSVGQLRKDTAGGTADFVKGAFRSYKLDRVTMSRGKTVGTFFKTLWDATPKADAVTQGVVITAVPLVRRQAPDFLSGISTMVTAGF